MMSAVNDENSSASKENECPSSFYTKSLSQPTTPSSSFSGASRKKCFNDVCLPEKDLPTKGISDLWQKPIKASASALKVLNSPKGRHTFRKTILPPTRLAFDHLTSDSEESPIVKQQRGCRRSLSMPAESTFEAEPHPFVLPKRRRLLVEETSPFDEISGEKADNVNRSSASTSLTPGVKKLFFKSQSDPLIECSVKSAVEKIGDNPDLIGDGSKSFILPLKPSGKHQDLKEISCDTLAKLLQRQEGGDDSINFKIIDCRYPYEFSGGHIKGAINLYRLDQIKEQLVDIKTILPSPTSASDKTTAKKGSAQEQREILIFHCEFSSHRGPRLCRYLRDIDRSQNLSSYPALFYPEMYVLFGGYKEFFEHYPSLCTPMSYVEMNNSKFGEQYRRYKSEAKLGGGTCIR